MRLIFFELKITQEALLRNKSIKTLFNTQFFGFILKLAESTSLDL